MRKIFAFAIGLCLMAVNPSFAWMDVPQEAVTMQGDDIHVPYKVEQGDTVWGLCRSIAISLDGFAKNSGTQRCVEATIKATAFVRKIPESDFRNELQRIVVGSIVWSLPTSKFLLQMKDDEIATLQAELRFSSLAVSRTSREVERLTTAVAERDTQVARVTAAYAADIALEREKTRALDARVDRIAASVGAQTRQLPEQAIQAQPDETANVGFEVSLPEGQLYVLVTAGLILALVAGTVAASVLLGIRTLGRELLESKSTINQLQGELVTLRPLQVTAAELRMEVATLQSALASGQEMVRRLETEKSIIGCEVDYVIGGERLKVLIVGETLDKSGRRRRTVRSPFTGEPIQWENFANHYRAQEAKRSRPAA